MRNFIPAIASFYICKLIFLVSLTISTIAMTSIVYADGKTPNQGLAADLAFHFKCSKIDAEHLAIPMEQFLSERGFRVLNKVRLAKQNNVEFPYTLYINGIDWQNRMVDIEGFPDVKDNYSLAIRSPPPTIHDIGLEDAVIEFVNNKLLCAVRQVSRGDNTAEESSDYTQRLERTKGWFKQAEEMQGHAP